MVAGGGGHVAPPQTWLPIGPIFLIVKFLNLIVTISAALILWGNMLKIAAKRKMEDIFIYRLLVLANKLKFKAKNSLSKFIHSTNNY
jgi:hypothetical protein